MLILIQITRDKNTSVVEETPGTACLKSGKCFNLKKKKKLLFRRKGSFCVTYDAKYMSQSKHSLP